MTPGRCPQRLVVEILTALPVAEFVVDLRMARLAERHEIAVTMVAALADR